MTRRPLPQPAPAAASLDEPEFNTVANVARRTGMSERVVRRWLADGDLPFHKFGRAVRIAEADLQRFIAQRRKR